MQRPPREAGIDLADWNWKVVRRFVSERFGLTLTHSSCLNYLHRLGFVVKRPIKRLLKADEAKRDAFVVTYAALRREATTSGAKHFFVDEAHFYADVDLHGKWVLKVGTPESTILQIMHSMIYDQKTIDAAGVGLSGSAVLPAFFAGKCAMTVQGNYNAQGMIQQAPKGFNWAMFPPLKGKTQDQAANPQTLSISAQSQHKAEAMKFIAYALNSRNMAKLSAGDWLIPAAPTAAKIVVKQTKHYGSWKNAVAAVPSFKKANWVTLGPYARWKAEVATPAFRQYLSNQIDLNSLTQKLVDGWNSIRG